MAPLVSALDSMKTDQAKASVCVVDLKTEVINRVFKSALPLLRKMRKIAADDRQVTSFAVYYLNKLRLYL
jgi:hypothetical protein